MANTQILKIMLAYRMGQTVAQISASQRLQLQNNCVHNYFAIAEK